MMNSVFIEQASTSEHKRCLTETEIRGRRIVTSNRREIERWDHSTIFLNIFFIVLACFMDNLLVSDII
jgi:hypothetical protein